MTKVKNSAKKVQGTSNASAPKTVKLDEIVIDLKQGRPMDPNSERQKRLAKQAANGNKGRGRAVDPTSARQIKLKGFEVKKEAGVEIKRGRPASETSARQAKMAARAEKILAAKIAIAEAQGLVIVDLPTTK